MSRWLPRGAQERAQALAGRLEQARAAGRALVDLTESDPTRCGLAWALPAAPTAPGSPPAHAEARAAIARYLAGRGAVVAPERVLLTPSAGVAGALLVDDLCDPGDEVLVPVPSRQLLDRAAELAGVRLCGYPLRYDGAWRIDRKALAAGLTPRTRAVVVASPSDPTGAVVSRGDLRFLEELCSERGLALIADEGFADTAFEPGPSVASVTRCLAFHLSGLATIDGDPRLGPAWLAAAGPDQLVTAALARLAEAWPSVSAAALVACPALLDGRERFLGPLRARLAENRAALATAALREASWTVLNSGGGWSAVLEIGGAEEESALCLALLDDGVVVHPGSWYGFERSGYLVVSLLPSPERFREGLGRLDRRLRGPLVG